MNSSSNISNFHFFEPGNLLATHLVRQLRGKDKKKEENGFVLEANKDPTKLKRSNVSPSIPLKFLGLDSQGTNFGDELL